MRLLVLLLLGFLTLASVPARANLGALVSWQKKGDSGAYVSSGFHDWRSVSRYRSRPGLHAGYDIAMLAGSAVRTPWTGTVVAITPWYGSEVGVSVRLDNGWEVTFGHIVSAVRVGQRLNVGDLVGRVVVDHVDVKVRDAGGAYVDFAVREIPSSSVPATPAPVGPSPEQRAAAAKAFRDYNALLESLSRQEVKVQSGLAARNSTTGLRAKLEALRPLAALHARGSGLELPKKSAISLEPDSGGRPVTNSLLFEVEGGQDEPRGVDP